MYLLIHARETEMHRRFVPVSKRTFAKAKSLKALGAVDGMDIQFEDAITYLNRQGYVPMLARDVIEAMEGLRSRKMRYAVWMWSGIALFKSYSRARMRYLIELKDAASKARTPMPRLTTLPTVVHEIAKQCSTRLCEGSTYTVRQVYEFLMLNLLNDEEAVEYEWLSEGEANRQLELTFESTESEE